jgi:hypothetical protein
MVAFSDESVHIGPGVYVLAVALVDPRRQDNARATLRALCPSGARRLHWVRNATALRHQTIGVVVAETVQVRAYLAHFDHERRQEDARRRCLLQMLLDHGGPPVSELVLDGRNEYQDVRDHSYLVSQCGRLALPHPPKIRHDGGDKEPLLWLADATAGAVAAHVIEGDRQYIRGLAHRLVTA